MKKSIFSAAAIVMALSFSTFAGTPETKGEAKPEVNSSSAQTYHYASESTANGAFANTANWLPGPSEDPSCDVGTSKPCEIMANDATDLANKLSGKSNQDVLDITITRD